MEDPLHTLVDSDAVLQPFLQAAQEQSTSNFSTTRTMVLKVLSQPEIVCGYDQIKSCLKESLEKAPDGDKLLQTLDLFSYGTYADYTAAPQNYLALTDAQVYKLRQLTVLSLVQQACQQKNPYITYDQVQQALQIEKSSVEDYLISCVYARVLRGQLCQKDEGRFLLSYSKQGPPCRPRDVHPTRVATDLLDTVRLMQEKIALVMRDMQQDQVQVQQQLDSHQRFLKVNKDRIQNAESVAAGHMGGWAASADPSAVSAATGQDPTLLLDAAARGGVGGNASRRQKRSRGGLSGMADPSAFGSASRFQL